MEVLQGGGSQKNFICTWCGLSFNLKEELEQHWNDSVRCRANRSANNPTQSKYWDNVEEREKDHSRGDGRERQEYPRPRIVR